MYAKVFRSCVILVATAFSFVFSVLVLSTGTAEGQIAVKAAPPVIVGGPGQKGKAGNANVVADKKHRDALAAARDYIKAKRWDFVVSTLQGLLEVVREDVMVPAPRLGPNGDEVISWVSVRQEANRMIGQLPKEGLEFYRLQNNQKAADLLNLAKETSDSRLLVKVATSYLHTDAGAEAIELLVSYFP
jgi:hypothetical protein